MEKKINIKKLLPIFWGIGWIIFGLLSGEGSLLTALLNDWKMAIPGLFFLLIALIPISKPRLGAMILLIVGILLFVGYPLLMFNYQSKMITFWGMILLGVPPLVSGVLYLKSDQTQ